MMPHAEETTPARVPDDQTPHPIVSLHWAHWVVVLLSLGLTLIAWAWSKEQLEDRVEKRFTNEATHLVELVRERMVKYEDALWGGAAMIRTLPSEPTHRQWLDYTQSLRIEEKYPGINGLGLITHIPRSEADRFIQANRQWKPDFRIYPEHEEVELLPIRFCEPLEQNEIAIGLDMAHEENRRSAFGKARRSGKAQITGPISLVQDGRTPGFLFFVPYYDGERLPPSEERMSRFRYMVYAPFIARHLMAGTLGRETRRVGIRITDGDEVLYDELRAEEQDFDPDPLFSWQSDVPIYGRTWHFQIQSSKSFRHSERSSQPTIILTAGIAIDALVLLLFLSISRSNRHAIQYAENLSKKAQALKESNEELEHFAFVASHDLQEPLRMMGSYAGLLKERYSSSLDETGETFLDYMSEGAERMQNLVRDLLAYSRVGKTGEQEEVDTGELIQSIVRDLGSCLEESGGTVTWDDLPNVVGVPGEVRLVLQNLISNGIKFRRPGHQPRVHVAASLKSGKAVFSVSDNGVGIEREHREQIFIIFQRLHKRGEYDGTGLGLAICKKIVEKHGGRIWMRSEPGHGTTFFFTLRLSGNPVDGEKNGADPNRKRRAGTRPRP